eukprot:Nk52_evm114s485 gene=Nk52_evmTU114s485
MTKSTSGTSKRGYSTGQNTSVLKESKKRKVEAGRTAAGASQQSLATGTSTRKKDLRVKKGVWKWDEENLFHNNMWNAKRERARIKAKRMERALFPRRLYKTLLKELDPECSITSEAARVVESVISNFMDDLTVNYVKKVMKREQIEQQESISGISDNPSTRSYSFTSSDVISFLNSNRTHWMFADELGDFSTVILDHKYKDIVNEYEAHSINTVLQL